MNRLCLLLLLRHVQHLCLRLLRLILLACCSCNKTRVHTTCTISVLADMLTLPNYYAKLFPFWAIPGNMTDESQLSSAGSRRVKAMTRVRYKPDGNGNSMWLYDND